MTVFLGKKGEYCANAEQICTGWVEIISKAGILKEVNKVRPAAGDKVRQSIFVSLNNPA